MKITPLEIKQKTFAVKSFSKGFDREEVNSFLHIMAQEWENLQDENKELRIKIELLEKEINKLKEVETSLYRTLKTAEDTSTNIVEQARKTAELKVQEAQNKADFILNDARLQAKGIVQKAQERARNTIEEMVSEMKEKERAYKELETYKDNFVVELRSYMNEAMEKLNRFDTRHTFDYFEKPTQEAQSYLEEREQSVDEHAYEVEKASALFQVLNEPETESISATEPAASYNFNLKEENNSFFDNLNS